MVGKKSLLITLVVTFIGSVQLQAGLRRVNSETVVRSLKTFTGHETLIQRVVEETLRQQAQQNVPMTFGGRIMSRVAPVLPMLVPVVMKAVPLVAREIHFLLDPIKREKALLHEKLSSFEKEAERLLYKLKYADSEKEQSEDKKALFDLQKTIQNIKERLKVLGQKTSLRNKPLRERCNATKK